MRDDSGCGGVRKYLQVEESLFEAGHDGCALVARAEEHIGECFGV